ncbi:type II toxin-antitoxin system VapC family toxin [Phototrophicus methaneseepsis]|uniref:Type II toxin-antitoxin system VapC family toxin n=1 Tax=Phototrophicus methaneseepsis TaxID=2710758 RepID=A0A7S8ECL3_9CHLR|nr:type II toxin-antitoxin system VapC family toxin [Phototrophicus methaneseepsis]QPC84459.1 type II toxin-antitoxin system VapC family toxin [Phototrophicus methaneseepsis]
MPTTNYVYFDSCVFLSYFNNETNRADIIEQILDETHEDKNRFIVTSSLSITEVAFVAGEKASNKKSRLRFDTEEKFDLLWRDSSILRFVDFQENLARKARQLMRITSERGYRLKPADAIHLVSAELVGASEFFTYDDLEKYSSFISIDIKLPYVVSRRMFNDQDFD